jgi:hypothetical protein
MIVTGMTSTGTDRWLTLVDGRQIKLPHLVDVQTVTYNGEFTISGTLAYGDELSGLHSAMMLKELTGMDIEVSFVIKSETP